MSGEWHLPGLPMPESYYCAVAEDGTRYGGQRELAHAKNVGRIIERRGVKIVGYARYEAGWKWVEFDAPEPVGVSPAEPEDGVAVNGVRSHCQHPSSRGAAARGPRNHPRTPRQGAR